MAYIKALTYYLPDIVVTNEQLFDELGGGEILAKTAGISSRRIVSPFENASDLAIKAANKLFQEYGIKKESIDFLLYCTQSPDYFMPSTACIIQDKLGLSTNTGAFGYDLGCSGYVYGVLIAKSFVDSGLATNVLLLTSDTISRYLHPKDKNRLLFGDAASATLISNEGIAQIGLPVIGTDGSGYDHIIIRNGANKNRHLTGKSNIDMAGNTHYEDYFDMDGEAIFNFTVDKIPDLINNCLEKNFVLLDNIDYFVFHQANKYMLNTIRKLNNLSKEKFYIDLENTGNTTSSTVPIGLVKSLKAETIGKNMNVMIAGFGVGLSWASTILKF